MLTAATAMLHASHLPPGSLWLAVAVWPWLAMALHDVDGRLVQQITEQIPKLTVDKLAGRLRAVGEKRREAADKALALETVRRGVTPATERARKAWLHHRTALHEAQEALETAKKERDELWEAAKAADQRVRDAQVAHTATLRAIGPTGQADRDARTSRERELRITRVEAKLAREAAEKAERVFVADLRDVYRLYPRQETVFALARLLGTSENDLMVRMGLRKKRELNDGERDAFVQRAMAGEPVGMLMEEYHIGKTQAYSILEKHEDKQCGSDEPTPPETDSGTLMT